MAVTKGLCALALQKAVKVLGEGIAEAPGGPAGSGDVGAIRALVDAVSKQQTAIKIELGPRIKVQPCSGVFAACPRCIVSRQAITLEKLPIACYPSPDPANKMAAIKAKQVKEGIRKPFPFMEMSEFLPSWANVVRSWTPRPS